MKKEKEYYPLSHPFPLFNYDFTLVAKIKDGISEVPERQHQAVQDMDTLVDFGSSAIQYNDKNNAFKVEFYLFFYKKDTI